MKKPQRHLGLTLISLWLGIGGALGVVLAFYSETQTFLARQYELTFIMAIFLALFGASAWAGFELWRRSRYAFTLARISLALQVPIFTVPGFSFSGFTVGATIYAAAGSCQPSLQIGLGLTSALNVRISPEIDCTMIGLNLLAVAALLYLTNSSRFQEPKQSNFGLI
jgi:hypothetical protein